MIKAVFETIWEDPDRIKDARLKFQNISDFYKLTDYDFLVLARNEPQLQFTIESILKRDLFKRCLVISRPYLTSLGNFLDLYKKNSDDYPQELRKIREIIHAELPKDKRIGIHDLWVDIPKVPTSIAEDPDSAWIDIGTKEMKTLSEFFPYPEWVTSYEINRWKGHVFSISDPDVRSIINETAKRVLMEKPYSLRFDERATKECKIPRLD
jgi:hypothetical protein